MDILTEQSRKASAFDRMLEKLRHPVPLNENSTLFHVGQEAKRRELLAMLEIYSR